MGELLDSIGELLDSIGDVQGMTADCSGHGCVVDGGPPAGG